MLNKAAVDRGFGRMSLYKKFEAECKSYECGISESIAKPPEFPQFDEKSNERDKRLATEKY